MVDSIFTEQGEVLLESLRNPGDPNTKGVSLEVEGIGAAVTVAVVIANQSPLSCF